jgi:hypothetical protein
LIALFRPPATQPSVTALQTDDRGAIAFPLHYHYHMFP